MSKSNFRIGTTLTTLEWIEVLHDIKLTNKKDIDIFQAIYSFPEHKTTSSQVGLLLGFKGKSTSGPVNLEVGRYGNRIAKKYKIEFTVRDDRSERKWDIFFDGERDSKGFIWQLKKELIDALEQSGLTDDTQYADEIPYENEQKLFEGAKRIIIVDGYERNQKARTACINHFGNICSVCQFDFEKTYGKLGKDFIHVHHLTRVADIKKTYEVDPIKHLRPVCPNCHAMLHKQKPPLTIEELKALHIKYN